MKKLLMILVIAMMASLPAAAQIPKLMTYQGVLTDDMGIVVSDGPYNITFRIYDVPSGGSPLWEETFGVNVSKGIFNTILGYTTPIDLDFDEPVYLALSIEGGAELTPRRLFTSNAHAFSALSVYGSENIFPSSGQVGIGTLTPEAPLTISTDISSSAEPSLLITNTGNQSSIDFKMATVTEARIRKAGGGDLFLGTVTGNSITFSMNNTSVSRMLPDGSFGIDNLSPLEKLDVNGAIKLGTTANTNAGAIRWTGADFEGYDGALWQSLTSGGGSSLPSGTSGQTLRHDGADWAATSNLYNNGAYLGIGTSSPLSPLHIVHTAGQVGLRVDSDDASWASIYVNASNASGRPTYGYQKQNVLRGSHFLDSSFNWNLRLDGNYSMLVQPDGWTTFGNVPLSESMNLPGALRLGTTSGSNAGTIRWTGSDFEGYDGGSWNSLTAGSFPAGTAGQTIRFDGADWIASSTLSNTGTNVGVGTDAPSAELHVYGTEIEEARVESNAPTGATAVELLTSGGSLDYLRIEKSGPSRSGTTAGSIPIANLSRLTAGTQAGALMLQTVPAEPIHLVTDNIERFRITGAGELQGYYGGLMYSRLYGSTSGGMSYMYDEGGNITCSLQADVDPAGGGYFYLRRNTSATGFRVDGNYANTEGTRVSVFGPSSSIVLDASTTGNSAVQLPADAVSAMEMLDEPGAVSATANTSTTILTTYTVLSSQTITAPADGYVLVVATGQAQVGHVNGTTTQVDFGVSDVNTTLPANQDVAYLVTSGAATGTYCAPVTCHGLFEVTAGANTFYFIGRKIADPYSAYCLDKQLTAIFIPTSYGTVSPTLAAGGPDDDSAPRDEGMTAGDISGARAASIEADNARIERELAEMRARLEALQAELDNSR